MGFSGDSTVVSDGICHSVTSRRGHSRRRGIDMLTLDLWRVVRFNICQVGWARLRLIFRKAMEHTLNLVESTVDGWI